jgi:hypothetical protein
MKNVKKKKLKFKQVKNDLFIFKCRVRWLGVGVWSLFLNYNATIL